MIGYKYAKYHIDLSYTYGPRHDIYLPPQPPSLAGGTQFTWLDLDPLVARSHRSRPPHKPVHNTGAPPSHADLDVREPLDWVGVSEVRVWLICCACAPAPWIQGPEKEGRR